MFIAEGEDFFVEAINSKWKIKYILINKDTYLSNTIVRLINDNSKKKFKNILC